MNLFQQVIMEYSRRKEERINREILESDPEKSSPIARLISQTMKANRNVWLMTDWHFIKYNKETRATYPRPGVQTIIKNCKSFIKPNDVLIYLGDICDGEIEKKDEIANYISQIPGIKILVRGNNDLFDDKWYLDHGFKYVTNKFIYDGILFSHRPQDNNNKLNIHGHIHGSARYYASEITHFNNQIDVAYFGGRERPLKLNYVIDQFKKYKARAKFIDHAWKNDKRVDGKQE